MDHKVRPDWVSNVDQPGSPMAKLEAPHHEPRPPLAREGDTIVHAQMKLPRERFPTA